MKKLLIVKVDGIGDYVLFRNFLEDIVNSEKYADYELSLLAKAEVADMAEILDSKYIEKFYKFDQESYQRSRWYSYSLIQKLNRSGFDAVLYPTYSRDFAVDTLINQLKADEKVGFCSDLSNISAENRETGDGYYTTLIDVGHDKIPEFERNRLFFGALLGKDADKLLPEIRFKSDFELPFKDFVVLSLGAKTPKRRYSPVKYAAALNHIIDKYNLNVVLLAGGDVCEDALYLEKHIRKKENLINLISATSIRDSLEIIAGAELLISNDTGISHISVAMGVKTIVLSNGNHFGRFCPYPDFINDRYVLITPFDYSTDRKKFIDRYYSGSELNIHSVNEDEVIKSLDRMLPDRTYEPVLFENEIVCEKMFFSHKYSIFFQQLEGLRDRVSRYILYGNGSVGKTVEALLKEQVLGCVDINDENNHPMTLAERDFDKVIITVLGREKEITEFLVNKVRIPAEKIVTFEL